MPLKIKVKLITEEMLNPSIKSPRKSSRKASIINRLRAWRIIHRKNMRPGVAKNRHLNLLDWRARRMAKVTSSMDVA